MDEKSYNAALFILFCVIFFLMINKPRLYSPIYSAGNDFSEEFNMLYNIKETFQM